MAEGSWQLQEVMMDRSTSRIGRRAAQMLLAGFCVAAVSIPGRAQQPPLDLQAISKETEIVSQSGGKLTIAWWMPEEFFRASFAQSKDISQETTDALLTPMRSYLLVLVVDAKTSRGGEFTFTSKEDLAAHVRLKDKAGNLYTPLAEDQVNEQTRRILAIFKPLLVKIVGPIGENSVFFLFPIRGKDGAIIADATREGTFYVEVGEKEFHWKLPLGSLLPRKVCPKCGESLSGAYKFCPYDGTKLPEVSPPLPKS